MNKTYVTLIALGSCFLGIVIGIVVMQNSAYFSSQKVESMQEFACSHSNDANAFFMLGLDKYKNRDYTGALFAYNEAILIKPSCLEAYYGIAQYYSDIEKNYKLAMQTLNNAEDKNPDSVEEIKKIKTLLNMKFHKKGKITERELK